MIFLLDYLDKNRFSLFSAMEKLHDAKLGNVLILPKAGNKVIFGNEIGLTELTALLHSDTSTMESAGGCKNISGTPI